jgi:hypothetical protein
MEKMLIITVNSCWSSIDYGNYGVSLLLTFRNVFTSHNHLIGVAYFSISYSISHLKKI